MNIVQKMVLMVKLVKIDHRRGICGKDVFKCTTPEDMKRAMEEDKTLLPRAEELYSLLVERANILLQLGRNDDYKHACTAIKVLNGHIFNLKQAASA